MIASFAAGAHRFRNNRDAEVAYYVESYAGRIGPVTEWFCTYPDNLATIDPHMTELDLPVLLFWGDLDQFLLPETAKRAAARRCEVRAVRPASGRVDL